MIHGHSNIKTKEIIYSISKVNPKLSLKKKIKLNDIAFDKIDHVTIPVFDLNNVYYADNDFNVYSTSLENGKINWIIRLENEKTENLPFIGGFSLYKKMNYLLPRFGKHLFHKCRKW